MEDPKWLRLITIGLILAALAIGYLLLSGRLSTKSSIQKVSQTGETTVSASSSATPSVVALEQDTKADLNAGSKQSPPPAPDRKVATSAYARIVSRTQSNVKTLPKTGFPEVLAGVVSVGIMIAGLGLRKFPH